MPCKGPCCVSKLGNHHERFGDDEDPACHGNSGHSGPHTWEAEYAAERAEFLQDVELRREANRTAAKVTYAQMLCAACRVLTRLGYDFDENPALSQWWDKHKEDDANAVDTTQ